MRSSKAPFFSLPLPPFPFSNSPPHTSPHFLPPLPFATPSSSLRSVLHHPVRSGKMVLLDKIAPLPCPPPFFIAPSTPTHPPSARSGKMVLLDKLMRRLKETGHRVLIFSQARGCGA